MSRSKKGSNLIAILITIFLFAFVFHNEVPALEEVGGMGYSISGSSTIELKNLNSKLEDAGYAKLSESFFSVGGGGYAIFDNRLIIGGEGHTLLGDEATSGNYKNSIISGYGFLNAGYVVYSINELRLYPLLGIGVGGMNFKIREDAASLSFDDILNEPKRKTEISTGGLLLNLAIGLDYLIKFAEDEKGKAGMLLGVRAGYTLSPFKNKWMMDNIEISGAPEIGITGSYIRFIIGGGGIEKKK